MELTARHSPVLPLRDTDDVENATQMRRRVSALERANSELKSANRALESELRHLQRLVYLDPLTELGNRRYFDQSIVAELRRAVRATSPLTLLICDVDRFKAFNDSQGHAIGDAVLIEVASVLERCCRRGGDLAARLGGDEFALLLPDNGPEAAASLLEKIRCEMASLRPTPNGRRITLSSGAATFSGHGRPSVAEMMQAADRALYQAKRAGRDGACYATIA